MAARETHRRTPPSHRQQAGSYSTTTFPVIDPISRMAALQLLSWCRRAKMGLDFDKGD